MHPEDTVISPYTSPIEEYLVFFLVFVGVLSLTYGFLFVIDFLPEKPTPKTQSPVVVATTTIPKIEDEPIVNEIIDPFPVRIIFDTLDNRTLAVLNPESSSVAALDAALLKGAVRHPDSADFEQTGTIFLFGHSSYLPNVMNKNFQAFNGIQKLKWGDIVRLQSSDKEYVYRVDRVYEVSAIDAEVKIESGKSKLTLVTCDSFGSKSDRFVVEASLIESRALSETASDSDV
jgi:LPXTG-site transpeptidase (sortase) family protein